MSTKLFVRSPNKPDKVFGAFSLSQLQTLVRQGKLKPEHEVSVDQQKWLVCTKVKPPLFEETSTYALSPSAASGDEPPNAAVAAPNVATKAAQKKKRKRRKSASNAKAAKAASDPEKDLTTATPYEPSGKCSRPWMVVPCAPLAPVAGYLCMFVGGLVGLVAGFILVGIPGMLLDMFMKGAIQDVTGGMSVRALGATIGTVIGGLAGMGGGVAGISWLCNRWAHNRSNTIAVVFTVILGGVAVLPHFIFAEETLRSLPPQYAGMTGWYWVCVAGLVIAALAGAGGTSVFVLGEPYCEDCGSYLSRWRSKDYAIRNATLMDMARSGATGALEKLEPCDGDKEFTRIELSACRERCCAFLKITEFTERYDKELEQDVVLANVKSQGFLNSARTRAWRKILRDSD